MSEEARQTISYLTRRFKSVGLRPQSRFGQNFLVDLNLLDLLVRASDIQPNDVVLEIGTGMGSLTGRLAQLAAVVVTVEIDPNLQQLAREELEPYSNIRYLLQDALRNKNHLNESIIEAVQTELAVDPARRFKVAANLPYCIATPVVSNLLSTTIVPDSMTVTIQKELAERIMARPSTKDYSALSIWIQSLCDVELIRVMPPSDFWPRPKVDSAIIQIRPQAAKRARIVDLEFFHQFIRSLFFHRRKFLRSVAISAMQDRMDKAAVDRVLSQFQLGPDARAEQLSVEQMIAVGEAFRSAAGQVAAAD